MKTRDNSMKTTKELLSQIKDTILNGGEEQADELLREFVSSHIKNDRESQIQLHIERGIPEDAPIFQMIRNLPIALD